MLQDYSVVLYLFGERLVLFITFGDLDRRRGGDRLGGDRLGEYRLGDLFVLLGDPLLPGDRDLRDANLIPDPEWRGGVLDLLLTGDLDGLLEY